MKRWLIASVALPVFVLVVATAGASTSRLPSLPLTASTTSSAQATTVITVGNLSSTIDRFSDVVVERGTKWTVETPPGVATNGGVIIATYGSRLLTATVPSQLLRFTPLASTNDGATWVPGLFDGSIQKTPNALTQRRGVTALLDTRGRFLESNDGTHWRTVRLPRALQARSLRQSPCHGRLVAVALTGAGPVFGRSCSGAVRSSVVTPTGSATPTSSVSPTPRSTLRLEATSLGLREIVWLPKKHSIELHAITAGTSWHDSVVGSAKLRTATATAVSMNGSVAVLGREGRHPVLVVLGPSGIATHYRTLPRNIRAVVFSPSGTVQLLSVVDHVRREIASLVTVWNLADSKWVKVTAFGVQVPYGSSH
ncbi:MAG: hypothetical protein WCL38_02940 [Actinomycetota bacterium]